MLVKSASADSFSSLKKQPFKNFFINRYKCKLTRSYKSYAIISGSVIVSFNSIYLNNLSIAEFGSLLTTSYFAISLMYSYVDNYLAILDSWRFTEAEYEDKLDPPDWSWKISNNMSHIAIVLQLLASISDDVGVYMTLYSYVGSTLQVAAVLCNLYHFRSRKSIICALLSMSSVIAFFLHFIHSAAILHLFSEIISI